MTANDMQRRERRGIIARRSGIARAAGAITTTIRTTPRTGITGTRPAAIAMTRSEIETVMAGTGTAETTMVAVSESESANATGIEKRTEIASERRIETESGNENESAIANHAAAAKSTRTTTMSNLMLLCEPLRMGDVEIEARSEI